MIPSASENLIHRIRGGKPSDAHPTRLFLRFSFLSTVSSLSRVSPFRLTSALLFLLQRCLHAAMAGPSRRRAAVAGPSRHRATMAGPSRRRVASTSHCRTAVAGSFRRRAAGGSRHRAASRCHQVCCFCFSPRFFRLSPFLADYLFSIGLVKQVETLGYILACGFRISYSYICNFSCIVPFFSQIETLG